MDKDYAQHYYAPNYAAKTGFFSAQKIVRKVVRSKTGYIFLVDRSAVDSLVDRKKTPQRTSPQQNEGDKQLGDKVGDRKIRV